jgi:dipeptidyl aminopeptidase/acylaminoacyl peptidase
MNSTRIIGSGVVVLALLAPGAAAQDPIVTTDLLRLRSVSSIAVSWDGTQAVVAVRSIGADPSSKPDEPPAWNNRSHLHLVDLTDVSPPRQLTIGDRYDHSPALSPDGRRVAFVRGRGGDFDAPAQVWVLPLDGGEARPVTDLADGAGGPRWSPDGRTLLVTSTVPIAELPGTAPWPDEGALDVAAAVAEGVEGRPDGSRAEVRAWLAENAVAEDPSLITRLRFQGEQKLRGEMKQRHIFLVDVDDLETGARRISTGFRDHESPVFTPDGRAIVYAARGRENVHPDRVHERVLRRMGIDGTGDAVVLDVDGWTLSRPRPSQDGSVIAFLARQTDEPAFRQQRAGIASITPDGMSDPVWLTGDDLLDASVRGLEWMPTRSALIFGAPMRGGFTLMTMSLGLLEPAVLVDEVDGLPVGVQTFGVGGGTIVYAMTSASNPCVLRVRDARGDRQRWDLNAWVASKELSRPVPGSVVRPDGVEVEYWLMEPARRVPGERYPLVLEIHGGPSAMWGPGEFTMWHEFQLLCSWGYGVVYANPRGSGGYGYEHQKGNQRNWGDGPAGDVLAVVDHVLPTAWVDPERLVVTGGSYGGYLTAWIVAHDHRFRAAVAQRGVYDLVTFFGEGNAWQLVEWAMGGYPWEPRIRPILDRESPFNSVSRIRTPLLIMHASRDLRTGVSQSEMLYRALKKLGRPVEYVRYPNAGHDLSRTGDPRQRMDRLNRMIDFFDRAVGNERPAPQVRRVTD